MILDCPYCANKYDTSLSYICPKCKSKYVAGKSLAETVNKMVVIYARDFKTLDEDKTKDSGITIRKLAFKEFLIGARP